ncbi:uncharacterized protein EV154DRAFT_486566 [Mucor mucedo]|uniref:uncharacterized protein n=1 Tax=Mucor mucedo TaxID=29922 RepID=UPI00221EAE84|nr:uncharacterized protein EV154DRAFT_486566 [Mucor mucedo]KAI7876150.1 hypothetical protein EV154DRAFT_486566 [Mucor mucedo]
MNARQNLFLNLMFSQMKYTAKSENGEGNLKFLKALVVKREFFKSPITIQDPPTEENIFRRDLGTFLLNLRETLDSPLITNSYRQSEIDFSIQNIAILFRFVFNSKSSVNVCWEEPLKVDKLDPEKMELGCGEVKLNCTDERLNEEDRASLGESLKKQLHYRIRQAKSTKEFYAFGIFVVDDIIELYSGKISISNIIALKNSNLINNIKLDGEGNSTDENIVEHELDEMSAGSNFSCSLGDYNLD